MASKISARVETKHERVIDLDLNKLFGIDSSVSSSDGSDGEQEGSLHHHGKNFLRGGGGHDNQKDMDIEQKDPVENLREKLQRSYIGVKVFGLKGKGKNGKGRKGAGEGAMVLGKKSTACYRSPFLAASHTSLEH